MRQKRVVDNVFAKPFRKSRIELDDRFINRVVPEILEHATELKAHRRPPVKCCRPSSESTANSGASTRPQIAAFAAKTSPQRLWDGPFVQLGNAQVEPASPTIGPTSTRARRSISRCIWASTWR